MDLQSIVTLTQTIGFPAVCLIAVFYGLYKLGNRALDILEPNVKQWFQRQITFMDELSERFAKIDAIYFALIKQQTEKQEDGN